MRDLKEFRFPASDTHRVGEIGQRDNPPGDSRSADVAGESNGAVSRLGWKARQQLSRALDWLPKPANNDVVPEASLHLTKQALTKALCERFGYPLIEEGQNNSRFSRELIIGYDPFGPQAEAIRSIRSEIASATLGVGKRSMLVLGARSESGATYLAANLALSFAQMSIPTLLVDTNLRRPRIGNIFGFDPHCPGLVEMIVRTGTTPSPINYNVLPNLSVLTAGSIPPNPQELIASPEFLALTDTFQSHFGVVIYDAAPGLEYADGLIVGARVGTAIMVARKHATHWADAQALAKKLAAIQCQLVGSVLNTH